MSLNGICNPHITLARWTRLDSRLVTWEAGVGESHHARS
jgi:hypothetical protein